MGGVTWLYWRSAGRYESWALGFIFNGFSGCLVEHGGAGEGRGGVVVAVEVVVVVEVVEVRRKVFLYCGSAGCGILMSLTLTWVC